MRIALAIPSWRQHVFGWHLITRNLLQETEAKDLRERQKDVNQNQDHLANQLKMWTDLTKLLEVKIRSFKQSQGLSMI